ncbi:unnamed protein product [Dicrocoelium dendriticum]|nr:unnamed protein product [Dicrocoelium dendriticum]
MSAPSASFALAISYHKTYPVPTRSIIDPADFVGSERRFIKLNLILLQNTRNGRRKLKLPEDIVISHTSCVGTEYVLYCDVPSAKLAEGTDMRILTSSACCCVDQSEFNTDAPLGFPPVAA